jgi:hypothetical protein
MTLTEQHGIQNVLLFIEFSFLFFFSFFGFCFGELGRLVGICNMEVDELAVVCVQNAK